MTFLSTLPLSNLRARLLLIVLFAVIPAFGLTIYNGFEQRQVAASAAQEKALRIARLAADDYHELLAAAQQLLMSMERLPAIHSHGPIECNVLLAELIKQYPFYANLGVIDREGRMTCSAIPLTPPVNIANRPYFQHLLQTGISSPGEFEIGTWGDTPSVNIGLPIRDETNQTQGILFASLDLAWFDQIATDAKLTSGAVLLVTENRNTLLARAPSDSRWSQRVSTRLVSGKFAFQSTPETTALTDADGVERLYAFVPVAAAQGAYIGVGIPSAVVYADVDQLLIRTLLSLTFIAVVVFVIAWFFGERFIVQPAHGLIAMTKRLRAGDLSVRAGRGYRSDEIEQLARAFDEMAQDLQRREQARHAAQTAEHEQRVLAEALRDTAAALNSTLDFDEVLDRILDYVGRVVPHDTANIMLIENDSARVVRCRGYTDYSAQDWLMSQRFPLADFSNLRRMIENAEQPNLIWDTRADRRWVDLPETRWIRSRIGAPIRFKGRVIGFLNLDSATPGFFNANHAQRLQAFADQAAIALENARLLRETERRADEFAALYATAGDLAAPQRALPILLNTIVERAIGLLDTFCCAAFLYDPTRDEVELVSQKGLTLSTGTRFTLGEGVVGHVARTRQPLILDDYRAWQDRAARLDTVPLGALLAVPMLYGGELTGVLCVMELESSRRRFTDTDARLLSLFATQTASAVRNARLFQETGARAEQLALLYDAGLALNGVLEPRTQLEFLFKIAMQALRAERAEFFRYDSARAEVRYEMALGFNEPLRQQLSKMSFPLENDTNVFTWVGRNRIPLYVPDTHRDPRCLAIDPAVRSGLWVPVENDKRLLGVLAVLSTRANVFTQQDERLLVLFANQAAVALENARLFKDLQHSRRDLARAYDATIAGWSRALDLRDEETEGHTQRVTELTLRLARVMGIEGDALEHIRRGALLHDIGKMGIPDRILFKPGPLTADEWRVMQKHPVYAAELIGKIAYLSSALDIPYCHHEKWDGSGYPRGLKGEEIPLAARIFAVADVWDALLSERRYREAWSVEQVSAHVRSLAGTHLDPQVVKIFLELMTSVSPIPSIPSGE